MCELFSSISHQIGDKLNPNNFFFLDKMNRVELSSLGITRLKEIAKELKIPRYSTYRSDTKDLLIEEILKLQRTSASRRSVRTVSDLDQFPPEIFDLIQQKLSVEDKVNFLLAHPEYEPLLKFDDPYITLEELKQFANALGMDRFVRIFQFNLWRIKARTILLPRNVRFIAFEPRDQEYIFSLPLNDEDLTTILQRTRGHFYYVWKNSQRNKISPIFTSQRSVDEWAKANGHRFGPKTQTHVHPFEIDDPKMWENWGRVESSNSRS